MTRTSTKRVLSDDAKYSRIEKWLVKSGYPKDKAKDLVNKYGMYAYDLMLAAQLRPYKLELKNGKAAGNTRETIGYILNNDIPLNDLAKITGVKADVMQEHITAFQKNSSIPTPLPVPTEEKKKTSERKTKVDVKVDDSTERNDTPVQSAAPSPAPATTTTERSDISAAEAAWIDAELEKMKKNGGLTFAAMNRAGITTGDMKSAMTPGMVSHVYPGPNSIKLAQNAPVIDKRMYGSGNCQKAVGDNVRITLGIDYRDYTDARNATDGWRGWEKSGAFISFEFHNDHKNLFLYQPGPCPGGIVSYGKGCPSTVNGHVAMMGMDRKTFYCDWSESASSFAKGGRYGGTGAPYGDIHISFTTDCTVSDELAREMLHQRYTREQQYAYTASRRSSCERG